MKISRLIGVSSAGNVKPSFAEPRGKFNRENAQFSGSLHLSSLIGSIGNCRQTNLGLRQKALHRKNAQFSGTLHFSAPGLSAII
jgi:hypothetical protein